MDTIEKDIYIYIALYTIIDLRIYKETHAYTDYTYITCI